MRGAFSRDLTCCFTSIVTLNMARLRAASNSRMRLGLRGSNFERKQHLCITLEEYRSGRA